MDFLDPKKQRVQRIRLLIGYIFVGAAVALATLILVYQAYGFGIDKNGKVIQNGLVFIASQPESADIYINGQLENKRTDTRLVVPAGQYTFQLMRDGYRTWKRAITVEGGSVGRFDYPFLVPTKLSAETVKKYTTSPGIMLQSPDRRWLLVQSGAAVQNFDLFDLKKPTQPAQPLQLPASAFTAAEGAQSWELGAWSKDNRHVLLKHHFQKNNQAAQEYVLLDRQDVAQSVNLSTALGGQAPTAITLRDGAYDQYYLYDQPAGNLRTASLKAPAPQALLEHVLAYKIYGKDAVLYATDQGASAGKALIKLQEGDRSYPIREVTSSATYLLEINRYSGDWYIAAGSPLDSKTYVYKNPQATLGSQPKAVLVPVNTLKVPGANYIAFSPGSRFIMAENSQQFALYDAENKKAYTYTLKKPLDPPQAHATWVDGFHLAFVSSGKTLIFDFDSVNLQTLISTNPATLPAFDPSYRILYTLTPQADNTQALVSAWLRTPRDQ